ncbi:MAG: hypothetical protein LBU39_04625 [Desulfobulbaceae bacterium]|nr:hypothetical protein [Desulfobulbaceae bacterium]
MARLEKKKERSIPYFSVFPEWKTSPPLKRHHPVVLRPCPSIRIFTESAMQVLDNINQIVKDDLKSTIDKGSRLSIAAARFSMYAYKALKKQLNGIDELRFIFTSPAFVAEKAKKEQREFYIPRLNRERSIYGAKFDVRLRNELTQKAMSSSACL